MFEFAINTLGAFSCVLNTPTGLGSAYEITGTAAFTETVTSAVDFGGGIGSALFDFVDSEPNWFEVYYDNSIDADNLAGTGFNDGERILWSEVADTSGGTFASTPEVGLLDGTGDDNWSGQKSKTGFGGNDDLDIDLDVATLGWNADFFKTEEFLSFSFGSINLNSPFGQVNPSKCFAGEEDSGATHTCNNDGSDTSLSLLGGDIVLGDVNGALPIGTGIGEGGDDILVQTKTSTVVSAIPEPASLMLVGIGLLGFGASRLTRKKQSL